jgi:hypothetical protein
MPPGRAASSPAGDGVARHGPPASCRHAATHKHTRRAYRHGCHILHRLLTQLQLWAVGLLLRLRVQRGFGACQAQGSSTVAAAQQGMPAHSKSTHLQAPGPAHGSAQQRSSQHGQVCSAAPLAPQHVVRELRQVGDEGQHLARRAGGGGQGSHQCRSCGVASSGQAFDQRLQAGGGGVRQHVMQSAVPAHSMARQSPRWRIMTLCGAGAAVPAAVPCPTSDTGGSR